MKLVGMLFLRQGDNYLIGSYIVSRLIVDATDSRSSPSSVFDHYCGVLLHWGYG